MFHRVIYVVVCKELFDTDENIEEGEVALNVIDTVEFGCNTSNPLCDRLIQSGLPMDLSNIKIKPGDVDLELVQHFKGDEDGMLVLSGEGLHILMFHMDREEGAHYRQHIMRATLPEHMFSLVKVFNVCC
jgi:hypothetical protein